MPAPPFLCDAAALPLGPARLDPVSLPTGVARAALGFPAPAEEFQDDSVGGVAEASC